MKTPSQSAYSPRFLNGLVIAALLVPALTAGAQSLTFSDRATWGAYVAAATTDINFSTRDDGSDITIPAQDVGFSVLSLRGVNFLNVRSYWNASIYVFPAQILRIDLPAGTYAFATDLTPFYGQPGSYSVELSTGEIFAFNPAAIPWTWDFFGVHSTQDISWVEITYANDYLAIDNFSFLYHQQLTVTIDIKPDSPKNNVNPKSNGMLPVAVFGRPGFDPYQIDVARLRLGVTGVEAAPQQNSSFQDVNLDGEVDLVVNFRIPDTGMTCSTSQLVLTGQMLNGQALAGSDSVIPVGCKP